MIIICLLIIASIIIITVSINWYANRQTNKKVAQQWIEWVENYQTDKYEKKYHKWLKRWEIVDKLNNSQPIVIVYDLPDSIVEEIIDYSLKLIEEKRK